jgi:hypothetical protein
MTTPSNQQGQSTDRRHDIKAHLDEVSRNPTEFREFFNECVRKGSEVGIPQQQLLDSVASNYTTSGKR